MARPNPYDTYRQTQILTASPERLVALMYEGAIRNIHDAQRWAESQDWQQFRERLYRTQCIVDELIMSLDHEQGGEISQNLQALYLYVRSALAEASANTDCEKVGPALAVMTNLKEAWEEACLVRI